MSLGPEGPSESFIDIVDVVSIRAGGQYEEDLGTIGDDVADVAGVEVVTDVAVSTLWLLS